MRSWTSQCVSTNSPEVLPVTKDLIAKVARTLSSLNVVGQPYPKVAHVRILVLGATPDNSIVLLHAVEAWSMGRKLQ